MTRRKETGRTLFLSIISLVLSVSMLVGTTMAWFTDTVNSGVNQIMAGNLDVELYHADKNDSGYVEATTTLFNDVKLWEPGAVVYENLTVENKGNLALKYTLSVNFTNETVVNDHGLSEALKVAVVEGGFEGDRADAQKLAQEGKMVPLSSFVKKGELKGETKSKVYGIVIYWEPTENDNWFNMNNENQGETLSIDLGVNLYATQVEAEDDSFGNNYDENSWVVVYDEAGLRGAIANAVATGNTEIMLGADIVLSEPLVIPALRSITTFALRATTPALTLNLGGFTLSLPQDSQAEEQPVIINEGALQLQNGDVDGDIDSTAGTVTLSNNANVGDIIVTSEEDVTVGSYSSYENIVTPEGTVIDPTVEDGYVGVEVKDDNDEVTHVVVIPGASSDNFSAITNAEQLKTALTNGGNYVVANDIAVDADTAINVSAAVVLDLNGKTLSGVSTQTGANRSLIVVGKNGDLTVKNGTVTMKHTGDNMGWSNSTNALEAVSGGKLTLIDATVKNLGGSDMAYAVNIANNGGATLKTVNSTIESANYVALRVFNNANGEIKIDLTEGTVLTGEGSPFFVHFWSEADLGAKQAERQAYLKVNFNNTEISRYNGSKSLVRFGFTDAIYFSDTAMTEVVAGTMKAVEWALENNKNVLFNNDLAGDVIVTQKEGVNVVIDGNGYNFDGVITVDGKSATYTTAGLTIKNLTFNADSITADACVRLGDGTNATRYTCNVTVENCTFDVPGAVGVKSYTGGDKNVTITGCTATANAHSLCQLKGVDGVKVENCQVNSKNGMNFNNSDNVVVDSCVANVKGYAVRFGESKGGSGAAETYTIKNSTLKAACEDGDSVIILRGTADNATLTLENTTLEGASEIANSADNATIIIDGKKIVTATTLSEVMAAAKNGNVVIDAQGANLGDFYYSGTFGNGTVLKNAKFTYVYGASVNGTVTFENCEFVSDHSYSANFSDGSTTGDIIFNNCLFDGWSSFGTIVTNVEFNNCTFQKSYNYGILRFYQTAQLNNCTFADSFEGVDTNVTGNKVELTNCTGVDGKIFNNGDMKGIWFVDGNDISDSIKSW